MENPSLITLAGSPLPLGASRNGTGINFALVSKNATSVSLILEGKEIPLDPVLNKTGDIWHVFVELASAYFINQPIFYGYKIDGSNTLLDPYAKAIVSPTEWGKPECGYLQQYQPLGIVPSAATPFDWENIKSPIIQKNELIIYEMHVRGFTKDPSSVVTSPGTFQGIIEKIPYLLDLGINAIELMPINEFNESEYKLYNPKIQQNLYQYWGYSTVNFFAPMNRFAASQKTAGVINEFKRMVKELHRNGIKVILDMVFNHTSESDEKGPITSYKGIDISTYYMQDRQGELLNFTGCGNTFNTNQPTVQQLIIDALRYWVLEMHVDGFRFDLASIFHRDTNGNPIAKAPIVEAISQDPLLAGTIMIAEPWDAVGFYQVGSFYPDGARWSEWNGHYRDAIRKFIKGTSNLKGKFASCISGSQDIYHLKSPLTSVNFITAHDGFTLADLVSYDQKHNLPNGENNHDGLDNNESWNCGIEGITDDPAILEIRQRQMRNFHLALMISQGIPMILMGDEYGHTKKGNNNSWCQDNELNWFQWDALKENGSFYRYYRKLIAFRKAHPILHHGKFLTSEDVYWYDVDGQKVVWDKDTRFLAFVLKDKNEEIYCAFNANSDPLMIELPGNGWHLVVNTANEPPNDYYEPNERPLINENTFQMAPYSAILLIC